MANMPPTKKRNRKNRLIDQFGSRCQFCGGYFPAGELTLHHNLPKAAGGGNNIENLRLVCSECHTKHHRQ